MDTTRSSNRAGPEAAGDPYLSFADHYDAHGWDWWASYYGPPLFKLMEERGIKGARVLDAGCGTGTLALALDRIGHRVTGLDLSETLLAAAKRKDGSEAVTWIRGDITRLDPKALEGPFALVTCVGDILNHLESLDAWEAAFRSFASVLAPGGRLLLDVMTLRGLRRLDKFTVTETDGNTLILSVVFEPATRRSTVKVTSFIPAPGTRLFDRASETIDEWGHPVASILERLAAAGFAPAERLWTRSGDPEEEDRLILLARRPAP